MGGHRPAFVFAAVTLLAACSSSTPAPVATDSVCQPGDKSCPCDVDNTCYSQPGEPLVCDRGYCVIRTCVPGALGCPCYGNGTCDPVAGVPQACVQGVCVEPGTEPPPPLCEGALCGASSAGVSSPPEPARSCELLLEVGDREVTATFADTARGKAVRRGGRLAIVFIARDDAPFASAPFTLAFGEALTAPIALLSATCADALGHPVPATLALQPVSDEVSP